MKWKPFWREEGVELHCNPPLVPHEVGDTPLSVSPDGTELWQCSRCSSAWKVDSTLVERLSDL